MKGCLLKKLTRNKWLIIFFVHLFTFLFIGNGTTFEQTKYEQQKNINLVKTDSFLTAYNRSKPVTHSLIIIQNGKNIFEKYYNGFSADKRNNLKSTAKSITSLLIGIAIDKGLIKDENQKIFDLLPEMFDEKTDPEKKKITIKDALTMGAGFEWNNFGGKWRSGWDRSHEPTKYLIRQVPLTNKPGTKWNYNSALSHLLSTLIKKYSGMNTLEFAKKYLFAPLGIKNVQWSKSKDGNEMGNSELFLTPRDLAKIGLLMMQDGKWQGKQIVSKEWIDKSTKKYFDGFPQIGGYGYQWHTRKFGKYQSYLAAGWGGQFLIIIPRLNMVIVNTSKWNVTKSTYIIFELLAKYVN